MLQFAYHSLGHPPKKACHLQLFCLFETSILTFRNLKKSGHSFGCFFSIALDCHHVYFTKQVLQSANNLEEVTENVDYYTQGCTIAAGNLFGR